MAGMLKRNCAPVSDEAWQDMEDRAGELLRELLVARRVVDVAGPHGWDLAAVNLGRLDLADKPGPGGAPWGLRVVLPLMEIRIPFKLRQMELDNAVRGCKDINLEALEEAVTNAAEFEDTVIFNGFPDAQIEGIADSSENPPLTWSGKPGELPGQVDEAVRTLKGAGVGGPYCLVLGTDLHVALMHQAGGQGYPPHRVVTDLLAGGKLYSSPHVEGGLLLSARGGDFEMTLGGDYALGYAANDRENVELFLTESFTFRVVEPKASVILKT